MIGINLDKIKVINDFNIKNKKIFLRADLNCPIENGKVEDDTRIKALLPTLNYILDKGGRVVIVSHHGRPHGKYDENLSLNPIAKEISSILQEPVKMENYKLTDELIEKIYKSDNKITMIENIRFCPEERGDNLEYAEKVSKIADIYINDAFGTCHRKHLSTYHISKFFEKKGIGFLVKKELETYQNVLSKPKEPFLVIMGGSKVSDKINALNNLMNLADTFLVGGAMSYTFLKSKNISIGNSLFEKENLKVADEILCKLEENNIKFQLPEDHLIVKSIDKPEDKRYSKQIPDGWMGVDIGPETINNYEKYINSAGTIIWNGPMGVFEVEEYSRGTNKIAEFMSKTDAFTVVGGGDSGRAVKKFDFSDKVDFISTGGGASLKLLEGNGLPCVNILEE